MSDDKVIPIKKKHFVPPLIGQDTVNTIQWTTPLATVYGVQLWEDGILRGTALYSEQYKANTIARILNEKYAELKVNHEAKCLQYPIF